MIRQIDHCNIRTGKIDETIAFYSDVLGLRRGPFPGNGKGGAWLYDTTERPVIHLMAVDPHDPDFASKFVRGRHETLGLPADRLETEGSGAIDHVAFECDDYDGMLVKFRSLGMKYALNAVDSINLRQIFVLDPNGITLELNFR